MFPQIEEVKKMLLEACNKLLFELNDQFSNKSIHAFVFTPNSGFVCYFVSISTTEYFDDLDAREAVIASEWKHIGINIELFDSVNIFMNSFRDDLYDVAKLTPHDIEKTFEDATIDVINQLISKNYFAAEVFTDDVLKGVQLLDESQTDLMLRASKSVNTPEWHSRLERHLLNQT